VNTLAPLAGVLVPLAALITIGYVFSCAFGPYKTCRVCRGNGQIAGPFGGIRLCPRCDGTGLRLRLGRRAWNAFRRLYREINNRRDR
jgi:hypothetical protein